MEVWKEEGRLKRHHNKKDRCSLDIDSEEASQRPLTKICNHIQKAFFISQHHPYTYRYFRSYPSLVAERHHQLTGGHCVIHPLSDFSLYWNIFMGVVNIAHMCVASFRLAYVLPPMGAMPRLHSVDHILLTLQLISLVDIFIQFQKGYIKRYYRATLNRGRIICYYLKRHFCIDLTSCVPITYALLYYELQHPRWILICHFLSNVKILGIRRDLRHLHLCSVRLGTNSMLSGYLIKTCLFLLSAHLLSCFTYLQGVIPYYWRGNYPFGIHKFLTLNSTQVPNESIERRYKKCIFVIMSAFFGTSFSMYDVFDPIEVVFNTTAITYACLFMVYSLVYFIKEYFTKNNSVIRYHELMNQLQEYMRHKQFPASLKKRVFAFYYYRYQGTYFREDTVLAGLSEQLRNEISLHTCHKIVNKVTLFEGLPPSVVGSILGCLQPEVYLPNDLVMRAGDIGDCMFLIANGTVAVYSLKGVEVCHLEDGDYFGEVALLMKDSKRVATVVAVEITQVYRLEADHFGYFIEKHQILHERIEALASQRMHQTVVLDEAFKRDREHGHIISGHDLPALSSKSHHFLSKTSIRKDS